MLSIHSQGKGLELLLCLFGVTWGRMCIVSCPLSKCFIRDGGGQGRRGSSGKKSRKEIQLLRENTHTVHSVNAAMAHSKIELSLPHSGL